MPVLRVVVDGELLAGLDRVALAFEGNRSLAVRAILRGALVDLPSAGAVAAAPVVDMTGDVAGDTRPVQAVPVVKPDRPAFVEGLPSASEARAARRARMIGES